MLTTWEIWYISTALHLTRYYYPFAAFFSIYVYIFFFSVLFLHPLRSTRKKKPHAITFLRHGQRRRNMTTGQTRIAFCVWKFVKKIRVSSYLKVATKLTDGGQPITNDVSRDLPADPSATSSIPVDNQSSEMRTLSFNLKWPPERALAISNKSLNRNKWRSRLCNPCETEKYKRRSD